MDILSKIDNLVEVLIKVGLPHHSNNHRPKILEGPGLFIFLLVFLVSHMTTNFFTGSSKVLGFATSISASEIINLTNIERNKAGLKSLTENNLLNKAAALKAGDMFSKDYWAHYSPDGTSPWYFFNVVGYKYSTAGENLARDFSTSSGVMSAWMASSGHRANILNPDFTEIGVAVVNGNLLGEDTTLVVQHFAKPSLSTVSGQQSKGAASTSQPASINANLELNNKEPNFSFNSEVKRDNNSVTAGSGKTLFAEFNNIPASQKVTLVLLSFIVFLLFLDSLIIFKKRHIRVGSHSFAHASVLIILIAAIIIYGKGAVI